MYKEKAEKISSMYQAWTESRYKTTSGIHVDYVRIVGIYVGISVI